MNVQLAFPEVVARDDVGAAADGQLDKPETLLRIRLATTTRHSIGHTVIETKTHVSVLEYNPSCTTYEA